MTHDRNDLRRAFIAGASWWGLQQTGHKVSSVKLQMIEKEADNRCIPIKQCSECGSEENVRTLCYRCRM